MLSDSTVGLVAWKCLAAEFEPVWLHAECMDRVGQPLLITRVGLLVKLCGAPHQKKRPTTVLPEFHVPLCTLASETIDTYGAQEWQEYS